MRLSMWMLNDWLKKYDPVPRIVDGKQVLRSARILSYGTSIEKQNVYIANASEFISSEKERLICVQGQDMILLNSNDMNEVLNDVFDAFDFYNSWADGISERIQKGCSAQDLIDCSHSVFHQPVLVYDSGNEIIGISSEYPKGSLDEEWDTVLEQRTNSLDFLVSIQGILKEQRNLHELHRFRLKGTPYSSVYRSLFYNRSWVGRIVLLEADHSLSTGEMQLFDYFGEMLERWIMDSDKSFQLREESAVFRDLIDKQMVSRETIDHKLQMAGWERHHKKILIRIEIPQSDSEISRSVFLRLERLFTDAYVIYGPEVIYILCNLDLTPLDGVKESLSSILLQSRLCAVASYPFADVYELAKYNEQCSLTYLYIPRKEGVLYFCEDYALECIRSFMHHAVPSVLRHPAIDILKEYDEKNKSMLYETLYTYLRSSCNMAETARILHLHRNSLLYRLNQIRNLTGAELDQPDIREYLLLSCYL